MKSNITLGKVEEISGGAEVVHLGRTLFRRRNAFCNEMVIFLPNEKHLVNIQGNAPQYNFLDGRRDDKIKREATLNFVSTLNQFLEENNYLLAQVSFKPYRIIVDLPFSERLKGELYKCTPE